MNQARDEAGNIWEVDASGNPVRLVQTAGAGAQPVTVGTPNPYALPKDAAELARTQQQVRQADATAPYDAQKAAADARAAAANATKAERDLAAQQATATPKQQAAMAALGNDEILSAIEKARGDINAGGSAGYWARLGKTPLVGGMIAPQGAVNLEGSLNTIASRLTLDKLAQLKQASPTGASGLGSLTEREGALLRDSVAGLEQTQSPERLLENLAAVEKHYRNFMALTKGEDYRDPKVAERYGIVDMPKGEQEQPNALARGGYRDEADPALKGVNAKIRSMIGAGRSANDIVAFMNSVKPGLGNDRAGDVLKATQFRAQNPTVPLDRYSISVENRSVPMSATRDALNTAAQTPGGAYFASAINALSANNAHRMADNPALAKAGLETVASENPISAFTGTATGGAMAGAGIEGLLPFRAAGALTQLARQPIADALYGGVASASDGGSFLGGATEGVIGGQIGRTGTRALGGILRGASGESAQALRQAGVTMTPGAALAEEGRFGRWFKGREDRLAGYSGVGDDIKNLQRNSLIDMNRAAFREAVPPTAQNAIAGYAEDGVGQLRDVSRGLYDNALNNRTFDLTDAQFQRDYTAARGAGSTIPRTGPEFDYYAGQRLDELQGRGIINGRQAQDVLQGFRDADFGNDAMGVAANQAAGNVRTAFSNMIDRQAPDVLPQLQAADRTYRNLNILSDAVGRGMNTEGIFTAAQLGQASRANAKRFNGPIAAATTDRPFFDLQRAAQNVLPSKVPDSGTAGRAEAGRGIFGSMRAGVRNLVNAPLYSEALQPFLNQAILDRPEIARRVGDAVSNRARLGGLFGAPLLVAYGP